MGIVVAVFSIVFESIINYLFLGKMYAATILLWRPMAGMKPLLPYGFITTLITSYILIYIYHRGYEGKLSKLAEGLRFGLVIGIFTALPMSVWSYVMMPMPVSMAIAWFVTGFVDMLIAGAIIGLLYKRAV